MSASPFTFVSGLLDCCTTNPESYKTVGELTGARLVEMTLAAGAEDVPHDHPKHSMFFVQGGKLSITPYGTDGKKAGDAATVEVPSGAPPIFPAGAHQVKNIGDNEVKCVFLEAYPTCSPCGDVSSFVSPFDVAPTCYEKLAEDDDWITGVMTMMPGESDPVHHHKDHIIYCLEPGKVQITFEEGKTMEVPFTVGMCAPAPMSAPPFAKHSLKNVGDTTIKLLFFEMKK